MPTQSSVTSFTQEDYLKNYYPSYLQFKDLETVKNRWSEYWPVLLENEDLLKLEMETCLRVEQDKQIVGSSDRAGIRVEKGNFVKSEGEAVRGLYSEFQGIQSVFLPGVVSVGEQEVVLANYLVPFQKTQFLNFAKINLYPRMTFSGYQEIGDGFGGNQQYDDLIKEEEEQQEHEIYFAGQYSRTRGEFGEERYDYL